MIDRDDLAQKTMIAIFQGGHALCEREVKELYDLVDKMIEESERNNKTLMRFCIGPVEKQPKIIAPATCGCKSNRPKGVSTMAFVLKDDEQVTATLQFFDKKGKLIASPKLDGVPAWTTTDPAIVTVTPAADGMSALIVAVGDPNTTATITATADGDLGEGVKPITTTGDVSIIGGDVATSNMNFGTPTPQP